MSGWLLPALVLMAALVATYVCCLRPMRSRGCHRALLATPAADDGVERQLREARAERNGVRSG